MSIAEQFDHSPAFGFTREDYAAQARRQFQISLGLVCILAMAAVAVAVSLWLDGTISPAALPAGQATIAHSLVHLASGR